MKQGQLYTFFLPLMTKSILQQIKQRNNHL